MKRLSTIFGLAFLSGLLMSMNALGQWSNEIYVSEGSNPDLDVDWQTGDVWILAMESGVLITKLDMNGNVIKQESVSPASSDDGGMYWGAAIACGPNGEPHVVYRDYDKRKNEGDGYYTFRTESGWSSPVQVYRDQYRGWYPRIDVDQLGRAHIAWGYGIDNNINGDIDYCRVENGIVTATKDGISYYRADVNFEMCSSPSGEVHVITGNASYPSGGGPVTYYNSLDGGATWEGYGDIHHPDAKYANGFVDISRDGQNTYHICYGTEEDRNLREPAIRYAQIKNSEKVLDVLVTGKGEIAEEHLKLGIGSVAASEDGKYVMFTYITGQDGGDLRTRLSSDGGKTWGEYEVLASGINSLEGRSRQYVRCYRHRFLLVYPYQGIKFRYYQIPGFEGPTAEANGPYSGQEGTAIQFSAAGSKDPEGIATYAWDWNNDGVFDDSTASEKISHTYKDDYNGQAVLRVRSNANTMSTDVATVTITNVKPTVELGNNKTENEGTPVVFNPTVNDPGTNDVLTYQWNFGDGSTSTDPAPTHAFADNGDFVVKLTVSDDDGGQAQDQITVTVNNVAPTADAGGSYTGRPNEPVSLKGKATDPGSADTFTFKWDLNGDGIFEKDGQNTSVQYAENGVYKVNLQVTDDDGGKDTDEAQIIIGSAAPVISTIPPQTINEGQNFKPIKLDDYVTDPDDPVASLTWLSEGNVNLSVTISNRVATVTTPNQNWYGQERVTFIAVDPGGEADSADVLFKVNPINDPPKINTIPPQTKNEGQPFPPIRLVNYVEDPDHDPTQMTWTFTGNSNLNVTIENQVANIAPADSEWAGTETITFKATDPEGASGQTSVKFTVIAVNDPPKIVNFPDQEFFQFEPIPTISLDETVVDPDHAPHQMVWSYFGNVNFKVTINNRVLKVEPKNDEWFGSEYISFVVTDPGSRQDTKSVKFTLNKVDARPVISDIPDQEVDEGTGFTPINMDNYVHDKNNTPSEINWSHFGQKELSVTWSQHIVSVKPPTWNWSGSETISFVATDPEMLKDTTQVTFTAREINDPPTISGVRDIRFDEDTFFDLSLDLLRQQAKDIDHAPEQLEFGLNNNQAVLWEFQPFTNKLHIFTKPDFCGIENLTLFVKDPEGATGEQALTVTVNPLPDSPKPFELIRPINESIFVYPPIKEYLWHQCVDPDPGDNVFYRWLLSRTPAFADTFNSAIVGPDTSYSHRVTKTMWKGTYYWKVIAYSTDGTILESPVGTVQTMITDVENSKTAELPREFALLPNHPNPFNPETQITYLVPKRCQVSLTVFNSLGQCVKVLVNEEKAPGRYTIVWNATNELGEPVSSGIYLGQLVAGNTVKYIKMIFMQ